ncbi:OmpA family protein [Pantoea sp. GbtcB22]|uniref:OmpA family protein n=1 Tax=Pantoea sp. GbtcB22 TaxID=2824767 RepID=UPI001C2F3C33|nr:OmpA family protein [Pantoea sp. GbtcB22]
MKFYPSKLLAVVLSGMIILPLSTFAQVETSAFGNGYTPVASVSAPQAQIVYYRSAGSNEKAAAHVYVDGEYQAALLSGGYTTFCVAAGSHSLGAWVNDAPGYQGKNQQPYRDTLVAGKTYFVKVDSGNNGRPLTVSREQAEQELQGLKQQVHTLSRASSVQQCQYKASQYKDYTLSGDVLFAFGKSARRDVSGQGEEAVRQLVSQIKQGTVNVNHITVTGHTDAIGSASANQRLGLQRAQTVRRMIIENGIPARSVSAESAGSNEPVSQQCSGSRAERISCMAPDRRVVVRVDANRLE